MPCYGNYNDGIMPFTKKVVNKNLSQTKQLSQKGNQDLYFDMSMVWRSLHHKEILLSEPGRNRREFILTRNSPLNMSNYKSYLSWNEMGAKAADPTYVVYCNELIWLNLSLVHILYEF